MSVVKVIANFETTISSEISATDTSISLTDPTDKQGTTIPNGVYGFTLEEGTTREEHIIGTISSGNITGALRGISDVDGTTEETDLKFKHRRGASIKITNFPALQKIIRILEGTDYTGASIFRIGDGTDQDIYIYAQNADANKPFIRYDKTTNNWLGSHDGSTTFVLGSGVGGFTGGDGIDITASVISVDFASNPGLEFSSNQLRVKVHTAAATKLARTSSGIGLDQSATPTWTGAHTFNSTLNIATASNWQLAGTAFTGSMALLNEATTFFNATNATGAEMEELTDGSTLAPTSTSGHRHDLFSLKDITDEFFMIGSMNDGATETTNGSASITRKWAMSYFDTGTTSTAILQFPNIATGAELLGMENYDMEFTIIAKTTDSGNRNIFLGIEDGGFGTSVPGAATSTADHIGFFIHDTSVYASCANGSTQTKTDISGSVTETNYNVYRIVLDAGTSVKFYVNGTLLATHTTNLPAATTPNTEVFIGISEDTTSSGPQLVIANNYTLKIVK